MQFSGGQTPFRIGCLVLFLIALCPNTPEPLAATSGEEDIKGDERIKVLRFLATKNEVNYKQIETWVGKYDFVDLIPRKMRIRVTSDNPNEKPLSPSEVPLRDVIAIHEGTLAFALDAGADKLWSEYQEDLSKTRFMSRDRKELLKPLNYKPIDQKEILIAERLTKLQSNVHFGPLPEYPEDPHHISKTSSKLAERDSFRSSERMDTYTGPRWDPRRFYAIGSDYVWQQLTMFADALDGVYGAEARERVSRLLRIAKSGGANQREYSMTMRYVTGMPEDNKGLPTTTARFTEKDNFLPVDATTYKRDGKTVHQRRAWTYVAIDGILIPREFHLVFNDAGETERLILDRHLIMRETVLNKSRLAANSFSAESLGLAPGDRLVDHVEKRLYVSDGNSLVPADQYRSTVSTSPSVGKTAARSFLSRWGFTFGLTGLSVVVVIIWVLRRSRGSLQE